MTGVCPESSGTESGMITVNFYLFQNCVFFVKCVYSIYGETNKIVRYFESAEDYNTKIPCTYYNDRIPYNNIH